jgi:hypothetical protein
MRNITYSILSLSLFLSLLSLSLLVPVRSDCVESTYDAEAVMVWSAFQK